ncbi:two-component system QseEF-associated lipoprotein QseG [Lonsdalea populi]|uniref:two-component system QseEF-associated lipoprotein QseG n=1 Tax=Lonsdalea populi TaxID=1172565 RepID=UPI001593BDC4|nr:two-component system QseEF-associated lipoprotein QseG [Lonsdalea populi]
MAASTLWGRVLRILLISSPLLVGCAQPVGGGTPMIIEANREPNRLLADYSRVDCRPLWLANSREAMANSLYWLRAMDCAAQLSPSQALTQANQTPTSSDWAGLWKQSLLRERAGTVPAEQRQRIARLAQESEDIPGGLIPLLQLWMDKQQLAAFQDEARARAQHLQDDHNKALADLREQQNQLREQLDITTRKLKNLTDIERQLSARKAVSADFSDGEERRDNAQTRSSSETNVKPLNAETSPAQPGSKMGVNNP